MRINIRLTLCVSLLVILMRPAAGLAVEDAIIAVVNDELITLKELKDYAQSKYVSLVAKGFSDQQIGEIMKNTEEAGINKLIEDKLILSKANAVGLEVREELVDERFNVIEEKYGSQQNLVNALIKNGATITDLRNKIRDQLKVEFIIDHQVRKEIYVNPQEVTNYYESHRSQYAVDDTVELQSIFISYADGKKDALPKAVEVFKKVAGGSNFAAVSKEYSDAPSVGTIERGQLLPEVEKKVFDLGLNETSPLIEVDSGIFIFKLIGKNPAGTAKLEEVKDAIYDQLFQDKFKTKFLEWLESLKKDAYIEIKQ